jgi:uncharacterized protein YyaL (SSP411 family)
MGNRLANSYSPYLRQHAANPVDWHEWGDEAFEEARSSNRPVFLSIGYSSCHWCHVMAHESFEDEATAKLMNECFVNVKVDREELPHVDGAYMAFVQLLTGRGGWPTSVFLTPDRKPFFGGTYWPRETFETICRRVQDAWISHREELEDAADQYSGALTEALSATGSSGPASLENSRLKDKALAELSERFDTVRGGFGTAPKFPPHSELELLLEIATPEAAHMASFTLEKMALGGIFDHVGGGFHRYSTDANWLVPHFEKMLYDNALLLDRYAVAAFQTGSAHFRRVANSIVAWLKREMTSPEGLFYSALDADSDGVEGKFYVWKWEELQRLPDADEFCQAFNCKPEGNFRDEAAGRPTGENILHAKADLGDRFKSQFETLREIRSSRIRPELDDKCLVGWNGLAIAGLHRAGEREMAQTAASAILEAEKRHGKLPHMIVQGEPVGKAFLDDYAFFIYGLSLMGGTWVAEARRLADKMIEHFSDPVEGGFYLTEKHDELFARTKPIFDEPIPSANAIAIRALANLGWHTQASFHLNRLKVWTLRAPRGTEALITDCFLIDEPTSGPVTAAIEGSELILTIDEGYHINGKTAIWPLVPVSISFNGGTGRADLPEGEFYMGQARIPLRDFQDAAVFVRYQACTETECLACADLEVGSFKY